LNNIGSIAFAYSDLDEYSEKWKLTPEDLPILVANIPKQNELKKLRFEPSSLTVHLIESFISDVKNYDVQVLQLYPDRVRTLTSSNFK
jgi:hypothetical protein